MNHKNRLFRDTEIRRSECSRVIIINDCGLGRASGEQMKRCSNVGWFLWQPCTLVKTAVLSIADLLCFQDKTENNRTLYVKTHEAITQQTSTLFSMPLSLSPSYFSPPLILTLTHY